MQKILSFLTVFFFTVSSFSSLASVATAQTADQRSFLQAKTELLEIIEAQDPGKLPIENLVQNVKGKFTSQQASLGIKIEVDPKRESVLLSEDGVDIVIGLPKTREEQPKIKMLQEQMVASTRDLDVIVQAIEGGVRHIITIPSIESAREYYDFPVKMPRGYSLQQDDFGNVVILDPKGKVHTSIAKPWAKDAAGKDIPTKYKVKGTTLRQYVDIQKDTAFPVVADPIWCGEAIRSVRWIKREDTKHSNSLSVTPTACGALAGTIIGGLPGVIAYFPAWDEVVEKTKANNYWDPTDRTASYWSMRNQFFCHAHFPSALKLPWNLEPTRPNVGYFRTTSEGCNPE